MNLLQVSGIGKKDERGFELKDINFTQQKFQRIAITGETGSGKSTLLKIIAGLIQPDSGKVVFEGERVIGPAEQLLPGHPGIAYLSQHFELRNNYRVEELLAMANKMEEDAAEYIYEICRISHLVKRRTDQLSGGEKQRIALARLLVTAPRLLLLDEPFSNLDMIHKNILKSVIHDIGESLQITCILISHDPLDTLPWAQEIIVMRDGALIQQASPRELYQRPVNEYAGGLLGKYTMIHPENAGDFSELPRLMLNGKSAFIRPENILISKDDTSGLKVTVTHIRFFGSHYEIEAEFHQNTFLIRSEVTDLVKGDKIYLSFQYEAISYI